MKRSAVQLMTHIPFIGRLDSAAINRSLQARLQSTFIKSQSHFSTIKTAWPKTSAVDINQFYRVFKTTVVDHAQENFNLDPRKFALEQSVSEAKQTSADKESFLIFYHAFIKCYYEKGADVFFGEMDKILENKSEQERKTLVNGMLYIMASAVQDDVNSFGQFIKRYGKYIDFESSYAGASDEKFDPFIGYKNNLFKCLIYNELWNVLDLVLDEAGKRYSVKYVADAMGMSLDLGSRTSIASATIPHYGGDLGLHKDSQEKYDLSALIINFAPTQIIGKYLEAVQSNVSKINLFEADNQDGLSIVEYAILFGRNDVLEMLMPEIKKQLERNPDAQKKINIAHDIVDGKVTLTHGGIKGALNHILLNNGCDRSFYLDANHKGVEEIDATKRSMGFDFPLRGMLRIYSPEYLENMRDDPSFDQTIRQELFSTKKESQLCAIIAPYDQAGFMMHGEEVVKQTRLEFAMSGHGKCKELLPSDQPSKTMRPKNTETELVFNPSDGKTRLITS